jgi:hypothetical protein
MKRILWHTFGAFAALVFAEGICSLFLGNSEIPLHWSLWAILAVVGFLGIAYYGTWLRSGKS